MADETQVLRGINWRDVFPFTHIFRSFRIAIHPSKLLLGLILLALLYAGGSLMDAIWANKHSVTNQERITYGLPYTGTFAPVNPLGIGGFGGMSNPAPETADSSGIFKTFFDLEVGEINNAAIAVLNNNWLGIGETSVINSVKNFVFVWPAWLFHAHPLFAILLTIWFLILWSVFGGAIARIAAIHVARDEKISVRQALRFSTGKALSFLFAPVIPILILLGLAALLGLGGLLLYVPAVGPITVGLLFVFALGIAFVMTLVLVGTVGGFNLMYPTVAVEGSDSFDAISRSFSYVFARPWRTIFYSAVALGYGALTYFFVRLFLIVLLTVAHTSTGWFLGKTHQPYAYWTGTPVVKNETTTYNPTGVAIWQKPERDTLLYDIPNKELKWSEEIAASLIKFWVAVTVAMLGAYVISFYFSSNTIIYFLLRREVDATDLDDVYVEQADEDFSESTEAPTATAATVAAVTTPTDEPAPVAPSVVASTEVPPSSPPSAPPIEPPPSNPPTT